MSAFTNYTEETPQFMSGETVYRAGSYRRDEPGTIIKSLRGSERHQVLWESGEVAWYYPNDLTKKNMNNYNPVSPVAAEILDADTQELIKAGYLNTDLSLTERARSKISALLFTDKKAVLIEDAKVQNLKNESRN